MQKNFVHFVFLLHNILILVASHIASMELSKWKPWGKWLLVPRSLTKTNIKNKLFSTFRHKNKQNYFVLKKVFKLLNLFIPINFQASLSYIYCFMIYFPTVRNSYDKMLAKHLYIQFVFILCSETLQVLCSFVLPSDFRASLS